MKRLIYILFCFLTLSHAANLMAVTDKEMEQARVIATQTYLRYANDGSDYLDALHPKTMAELESKLKNKEKENIKAFKAIPVPKDYASWDKKKLVEYWSTTAFASSGLTAKGKIGKVRAQKRLNNMTIADPASAKAPEAAQPAAVQPAETSTKAEEPKKDDRAVSTATSAKTEVPDLSIDSTNIAIEEKQLMDQASFDEGDDASIKKVKNNTWIYVVILVILVGVVIALVVFASNVLKRNAAASGAVRSSDNASSNDKALRNKLKGVSEELQEALQKNDELKRQVEALTAELNSLRKRQPSEARVISTATPATQPQRPRPQQPSQPADRPAAVSGRAGARSIYLAKANSKGIFTRADGKFNPEFSVFKLDTTDGFAGSFRVISNESVIDKIMQNPLGELANACIGPDLEDPDGLESIVTDSAGTAIFEGGRWKVSRKAKIHYE